MSEAFSKQLLSGSGAYDGTGTAGVERGTHEIETDYWRGPGTRSKVDDSHS